MAIKVKPLLLSCLLLVVCAYPATLSVNMPTVAVISFTGDGSISVEQMEFLTRVFSSEIVKSDALVVVERNKMDEILKEQGFQQTGACNTNECKVQVGQLLGVDFLISGSIVNFQQRLALHLDYIDVSTGQIRYSINHSENGNLADNYQLLCERSSAMLLNAIFPPKALVSSGQPVPKMMGNAAAPVIPADAVPKPMKSRISVRKAIALVFLSGAMGEASVGIYYNEKAITARDQYDITRKEWENNKSDTTATSLSARYSRLDDMNSYRSMSYGISLSSLVIGLVLWFWPEGKK